MDLELGPLQLHLAPAVCWLRLFGFGVHARNERRRPSLYSHRGTGWRVGRFRFGILRRMR